MLSGTHPDNEAAKELRMPITIEADARHLGDIFSWSLPRPADHNAVIAAAHEIGGNELAMLCPDAPPDAQVLHRVRTASRARGKNDVPRVLKTKDRVVYEVNERQPDVETETTDYEHKSKVVLDLATGACSVTGLAGVPMQRSYEANRGKLMRTEWSEYATRVVAAIKARTISESGGTYWVPVERDGSPNQMAQALDQLFRRFGGRVRFYETFDSDRSTRTLREDAAEGFLADVKKLKEEVDGFGERTQERTLQARIAQLQELRSRAGWVAGLLRQSADNFDQAIAEQEGRLKRMLLGLPADEGGNDTTTKAA